MTRIPLLAAACALAVTAAACTTAAAQPTTAPTADPAPADTVGPSEDTTQEVTVTTVDAPTAVELLEARSDVTVIDVRTPAEFAEAHLPDAALIDIQAPDFQQRIEALDRDATYVVYCRSGNRSAVATRMMAQLGFTSVYDAGGLADLARAGAELTTG
jgi:phage shock protein E